MGLLRSRAMARFWKDGLRAIRLSLSRRRTTIEEEETEMTSTETTMPDYSIDPAAMSTEAIERDLPSYAAATGQVQL
jgi:hypothetical protein